MTAGSLAGSAHALAGSLALLLKAVFLRKITDR